MVEPTYQEFSKALRQVLARSALATQLKSSDTAPQAMKTLGIPSEDVRVEIINILNQVEAVSRDSVFRRYKFRRCAVERDAKCP